MAKQYVYFVSYVGVPRGSDSGLGYGDAEISRVDPITNYDHVQEVRRAFETVDSEQPLHKINILNFILLRTE